MDPARKPLARMDSPPMESREPHSIRFMPSEWERICAGARQRGLEPAVFVRMLTMYGLSIAEAPTLPEAAPGKPAQMLAGSRGIGRF